MFQGADCCQSSLWGFPGGASDKEPAYQWGRCKRPGFDPWVGKIPCWRTWQPTPVFWPQESHGQRSLAGCRPWDHRELGHDLSTKNNNNVSSHHWVHESPSVCCVLSHRSVYVSSVSFTGVAVTLTAKLYIGKSFRGDSRFLGLNCLASILSICFSLSLSLFWPHCIACGISVPRPGIESRPPQ